MPWEPPAKGIASVLALTARSTTRFVGRPEAVRVMSSSAANSEPRPIRSAALPVELAELRQKEIPTAPAWNS